MAVSMEVSRANSALPDHQEFEAVQRSPDDHYSIPQLALGVLTGIPEEKKSKAHDNVVRLLRGTSADYQRTDIAFVLSCILPARRAEVLELAVPICMDFAEDYQLIGAARAAILKDLDDIPEQERQSVLDHARPSFAEIKDGFRRTHILRALGLIPRAERPAVSASIVRLLNEERDLSLRAGIVQALSLIPEKQRGCAFVSLANLVSKCRQDYQQYTVHWALERIPADQRVAFLHQIPFLEWFSLYPQAVNCLWGFVVFELDFIPPDMRFDAFLTLNTNRAWLEGNIFSNLKEAKADLLTRSHAFLDKMTDDGDDASKHWWADRIVFHAETLGLTENHPLLQKAHSLKAIGRS